MDNGLKKYLEQLCIDHKLLFFGVAKLGPEPRYKNFLEWINEGRHGELSYLENHAHCRENPQNLLEGAKSGIVVGLPYGDGDRFISEGEQKRKNIKSQENKELFDSSTPRIAQYARFKDYHKTLRKRGTEVLEKIHLDAIEKGTCSSPDGRVTVDSAPVLERALAERTQEGFIGKNTCYIHPKKGSMFCLGVLLTTIDLEEDKKVPVDPHTRTERGGCGSCRRCEVHCPTGAIQDYKIDASLCLAYHSIESRDVIPMKFWQHFDRYIFGCDICQLVCPYNRTAEARASSNNYQSPVLPNSIDPYILATLTHSDYLAHFAGSPVTRAKRFGLIRNGLVSMCVKDDKRLESAIAFALEQDHSMITKTIEQIRIWQQTKKA